jgi:hypothetical protein
MNVDRSEVTDIVRATVTTSILIVTMADEAVSNGAVVEDATVATTAAIERIIEKAVDLLVDNDEIKVGASV